MTMTRTGDAATEEQREASAYLGSLDDPLAPWVRSVGPIDPNRMRFSGLSRPIRGYDRRRPGCIGWSSPTARAPTAGRRPTKTTRRCRMKAIVVTDESAGTAGMTLAERPDPEAGG